MNPLESINYCTTRICGENAKGEFITGTGFFYELFKGFIILVTNKHVVEDIEIGYFFTCLSDDNFNPIDQDHQMFMFKNVKQTFKFHPDDNVDLCAMQIGSLINACESKNIKPFLAHFTKEQIPQNCEEQKLIPSMQDVYMIGYPNGLWDEKNNKPISRKGITASKFEFNYNNKEEFLIDMACFPGSSGSPILMHKEFEYNLSKSELQYKPKYSLLGILYAGPMYNAEGEIIVVDVPTTNENEITDTRIPMNLGYVIKSSKILDFEDLFDKNESMQIDIARNVNEILS